MDLIPQIELYVRENIEAFHNSRIEKLKGMKLKQLLKRKNPYLYKAKDLNTPGAIVESLATAFMSSAEETLFGDWLEQLAIHIAQIVYGGTKSTAEGIDLEIDKEGVHYAISIKSGPNWCNSSSLKKMKENFLKAQRIYRTSGNKTPFAAIEGCCYGEDRHPVKDTHEKLCGAKFWSFISGTVSLYTDLIEPLGTNARTKNREYQKEYDKMITRFTKEFANEFCLENGEIDWKRIVTLNSGYAE